MIRYLLLLSLCACSADVTCDVEPGEPDIAADCRVDEHGSCDEELGVLERCEVAYVCKLEGVCRVWTDEACLELCD